MDIEAKIEGIEYRPHLCRHLREYNFERISYVLTNRVSSFKLNIDNEIFAVSKWVSPKRTRSYPYERVYDTLSFTGKRITIIPVVKDEGVDGDRDFIQWDTICLMSLLNVYVIPAYYCNAVRSARYQGKITKQMFDVEYIARQIREIKSYQSDGLHWNMNQFSEIGHLMHTAYAHYERLSQNLGVSMHSREGMEGKIRIIDAGVESFRSSSRELASAARGRESSFTHLTERVEGEKGSITIANFYGGLYYFTVDECRIEGNKIYLAEAKHSSNKVLPSNSDIKDALLKMAVLTNLQDVKVNGLNYSPIVELKLTSAAVSSEDMAVRLTGNILLQEARENAFRVVVSGRDRRALAM